MGGQLSWSHYRLLFPIKEENKRNYYTNRCLEKNLSRRELEKEIKSNAYERLVSKPNKIEILVPNRKYSLLESIKNPIIIELEKKQKIITEHDLETTILAKLQNFFSQLVEGFALINNQYKISYGNKTYYIDILLFNVEELTLELTIW